MLFQVIIFFKKTKYYYIIGFFGGLFIPHTPPCFNITFKLLCLPNSPVLTDLKTLYLLDMDSNSSGYAIVVYNCFERKSLFVCDLFVQINYNDLSSWG